MSSFFFVNKDQKPLESLSPRNPDVLAFHQSLPHYALTPLVSLPIIGRELGIAHLLLKYEGSRLGLPAFKMLGASYATVRVLSRRLGLEENGIPVTSLEILGPAAQKQELTLYAATDGNHGRAVAKMARYLGIKARIFVPSMLDQEAKSKIASEGAEVVVVDGDYDFSVLRTKEAAERHVDGKGVLISDTALDVHDETAKFIVDGYQTMFDEIEDQVPRVSGEAPITHVLTPVGVGSLAQAVVTHFGRRPASQAPSIITVEPETAACLKRSLEEGEMTSLNAEETICSGMCCGTLSATAWPLLKDAVAMAVVVGDAEVHEAVSQLSQHEVYAGPCGAATLAGLAKLAKSGTLSFGSQDIVVILCTEGKRGYRMKALQ